jgi:hypothetical protein
VPSRYSLLVGEEFTLTCKIDVKPNTHVEMYLIYKQQGSNDENVSWVIMMMMTTMTMTR